MTYLVNPDNLKIDEKGVFPESVSERVPGFLVFFGSVTFVSGLVGIFLIRNFDQDWKKKEDKNPDHEEIELLERSIIEKSFSHSEELIKEPKKAELSEVSFVKQYVVNFEFFLIMVVTIIRYTLFIYTQNNFKIISIIHINDDHFISNMATITFVLNLIMRLLMGKIIERIGIYNSIQCIFSVFIAIYLIYIFYPSSRFFYVINIALIRAVSGMQSISFNSLPYLLYDREVALRLLKYYMFTFVVASYLSDLTDRFFLKDLDYRTVFDVLLVSIIFAMGVNVFWKQIYGFKYKI